ncbi:MAG: chloride channel protein, partial [Muribaculaceae bacterium]|nr:chloride channel protein [Muribaculaceae bacterium]
MNSYGRVNKTGEEPRESRLQHWLGSVRHWRETHIKEKTFVVMLALVVGAVSGLAAVLLKFLIGFIAGLLTKHVHIAGGNYEYLVFPVVGILLAGLYVRYVIKDDIYHGVTRVLYAIAQRKSRLKPHNMYASLAASSVTIGFGGSVGAEGPIVFTGAA